MVHQSPEILAQLRCAHGKSTWTLSLTDDFLIEEGRGGARVWRQAWVLGLLSPEVEFSSGRPSNTETGVRAGVVLIGLAACLFFSDLHPRIPLLAPLVTALGVWPLAKGLKNWPIETWTIFRKADGTMAAHVNHAACQHEERRAFEEAFAETVRLAQKRQRD